MLASGTFEALSHSGVDFASLLKHQEDDNAQEDSFTRNDKLENHTLSQRRRSSKAICSGKIHLKTTVSVSTIYIDRDFLYLNI